MRRTNFQCQVCLEDKQEPRDQVRYIDGDPVCRPCIIEGIVPLFSKALQNELEYPPCWGTVALDIEDYRNLMPAAVLNAWYARVDEYKTPIRNRAYCSHMVLAPAAYGERRRLSVCGNFLGSTDQYGGFQCSKCNSWSKDHHLYCPCGGAGKQNANLGQAPLNQRTRGLEWETCPKCEVAIERSSGCNHLECPYCHTEFCFICGNLAEYNSGHWEIGGACPRYGQPEDKSAVYDEGVFAEPAEAATVFTAPTATMLVWEGLTAPANHEAHDNRYVLRDRSRYDTYFGQPLIEPRPGASPEDMLRYDGIIAIYFTVDLKEELRATFGTSDQAPDTLKRISDVIDQDFSSSLATAERALYGYVRNTAVDKIEQTEKFYDFQSSYNRLRQGFWQSYNKALTLLRPGSVLRAPERARLFRQAFERYLVLHAPLYISKVGPHVRLWDTHGDALAMERNARRV